MKILFMGDHSGYHSTLATQLRKMGHDCVVASNGSRCMDTTRDIETKRNPGLYNSFKYLWEMAELVPKLKGFDIVQFNNPGFLSLRPGKLKYFFKKLKKQNGKIGLTLCGSDALTVKTIVENDLFRYSEIRVNGSPTAYFNNYQPVLKRYQAPKLVKYTQFIYDNIDCAVSALYEYHILAEFYWPDHKINYIGIPVNTKALHYVPFESRKDGKLNICVAIKSEMMSFKGTDIMLRVARKIESLYPDKCKVTEARDLSLNEYLKTIEQADVVLDQLYSYTPATNALQTMAMGKISVSGAEPEYYDFIGENSLHPIISAVPNEDQLADTLLNLIELPDEKLKELSIKSREFVEKHNSSEVVAQKFLKSWEPLMK